MGQGAEIEDIWSQGVGKIYPTPVISIFEYKHVEDKCT